MSKRKTKLDSMEEALIKSIESHKRHLNDPYWKGSHDMAENILSTVRKLNAHRLQLREGSV